MRLHYHPLSPFSRKVSTAIALRKDPIELHVLDVFGGELDSDRFRALSPFGKIPVLEMDDGSAVIESTSILELLEDRGPRMLLPAGLERIARHYDRLGDLYLIPAAAALWWRPTSDEGRSAASTAEKAWTLFAQPLAKTPFVAGDAFSLADLGAAIATDYLVRLGVDPPPAIRAWASRCFDVPAMAESLATAMPWIEKTLGARTAATS